MVGKYRLIKDTLGIVISTRLGVAIPAGEIISIVKVPLAVDRTVDVLWNGKVTMMFVSDLHTRAEPISD